jgi:hypothetical protein
MTALKRGARNFGRYFGGTWQKQKAALWLSDIMMVLDFGRVIDGIIIINLPVTG